MPLKIALQDLPASLDAAEAVALAYPAELAELAAALQRGLPCLVECAKELTPYCVYIDGRPGQEEKPLPLVPESASRGGSHGS